MQSIKQSSRSSPAQSTSRYRYAQSVVLLAALIVGIASIDPPLAQSASPTITFVQGNYAAPSQLSAITVPFTQAQTAGDLNVVVVGWDGSSNTVESVKDTSGNVYTKAVGPTQISSELTQLIYYAKNIVASSAFANAVTVTFASNASDPDVRILEYSGANTSTPVDVVAAGTGSSDASATSSITTTNATDLIFGANTTRTTTTAAGSSFTKRMITLPHGDIVEDRMVTATGSYTASASLSASNDWVMQMVAFRTPTASADAGTLSATPATLSFGDVTLGSSSVLPAEATNTGTTNVTLSTAAITGAGFSFTGPSLPVTLSPGQAASFSVTFDPNATGDVTGALSVTSNAANSPASVSLSAAGVNKHTVALDWTASTSTGISGYDVYRGTASGGPYTLLNSSPVSGTTYTDSTVQAGDTYYYVATAVNSSGAQSADSNQATAVVPFP
jgi:hypothetical protein